MWAKLKKTENMNHMGIFFSVFGLFTWVKSKVWD